MDIVLFWGPRQSREDLDAVTKAARDAGLKIRVVEVTSGAFMSSQLKEELYRSGALGPHTQVIARFAVAEDLTETNQYLLLSESGGEALPAFDFISWLRTPPPGMPGDPPMASWRGTVHAFWPHSGMLRDRFEPDQRSWTIGTMLTYSARKGQSRHNAVTMMLDLCDYLGSAKHEPACLAPEYVAARMLGVAGDTFACFGGNFEQAVVVGAPRMPEQARKDYLLASLEGGNGKQERIVGASRDLRALACAMRHPRVRGAASQRQQTKLENVYAVRAERFKLSAMDALLKRRPQLGNFRTRSGWSARMLYDHVASTEAIRSAMCLLSEGQGGVPAVICVLDNMDQLCRMGAHFSLNLAEVLHGKPALLSAALRWTAIHEHEDMFIHLWPAIPEADKSGLMAQCLALALEHSPQLALGLLSLLHPAMTIPDLIVRGMHDGASRSTVLAWLSGVNWMEGDGCTARVLETMCDVNLFFTLLPVLAERFPAVFDRLLKAMRKDMERCSSYAEALLQHAQEHRNTALYRKIAQGYFLVDRSVAEQPASFF